MLQALRSLRKQARNQGEDRAIARLIVSRPKRAQFSKEVQEQFGWDGENLKELLRIFLEHLPEILALILRIMK
jgi:hypothetical protein